MPKPKCPLSRCLSLLQERPTAQNVPASNNESHAWMFVIQCRLRKQSLWYRHQHICRSQISLVTHTHAYKREISPYLVGWAFRYPITDSTASIVQQLALGCCAFNHCSRCLNVESRNAAASLSPSACVINDLYAHTISLKQNSAFSCYIPQYKQINLFRDMKDTRFTNVTSRVKEP